MGSELIADSRGSHPAAHMEICEPWQEALPRIEAYLRACGIDDPDRRANGITSILDRLHSLLPLHQGENPVQIAMRETVQWIEDCQQRGESQGSPDVPATPPRSELEMPQQDIELRGLRWRRKTKTPKATSNGSPSATRCDSPGGPANGERKKGAARHIRSRRILFAALVGSTTGLAIMLLLGSMQQDGLSPLEFVLVVLYAVLFAWICTAFWTAFAGFVIRLRGIRQFDIRLPEARPAASTRPRTALIMPIYNETPRYVFARIQAIYESLMATPAADDFDLFILSDTRDPDLQVEEELRWSNLCRRQDAGGRIFYRNRKDNQYRKAGNIADFVRSWGGHYKYMTILDADSLMSGSAIVSMIDIMEEHPRVGVLQAPPVPVNNHSLFARVLQFAGALYGPLYTAGMNFWQGPDASYFGHNAVIRVEPFAMHCGLPSLPGNEPFGGPILSHDFVEAATLRRAGWEAWLANDLDGSFEEIPPTLIDYAKRDRRWCQGNLQHARLVAARGWRGLSRLHFGMAVMSYLASPLWFLFLLAAGVEAWLQSRETPVYFFGDSLFPVWPVSYAFELTTVLLVTLFVLFLPKLLALVLLFSERERWRLFGGRGRAALSVLLESLFSVITAPVLMVFQTKFVVAILLRKNVGWPSQQREDRMTTWSEALLAHRSHLLLGIAAGLVAWFYVPGFFWWFTPVLAGLLLAVPVSVVTSRSDLGDRAAGLGLFLAPQEVAPDDVVKRYHGFVAGPDEFELSGSTEHWRSALLDPGVYQLHRSLLPVDKPTRRQRHHLDGLMYTLIDQGEDRLEPFERRAMITNNECLKRIHVGLWSELPLHGLVVGESSAKQAS